MKFDRNDCHDKKKKKSGDNIWGLLRLLHETVELLKQLDKKEYGV